MLTCYECDAPIRGHGAILPGDEPDLVCSACFTDLVGHPPFATGMVTEAMVARAAKVPGKTINYTVTIENQASRNVIKRISKKNALTVKNLPPGNYTVSYNSKLRKKRKILAKS